MSAPAFTAAMALMLKYQRMRLTVSEVAAELGIAVNTIYNRGDLWNGVQPGISASYSIFPDNCPTSPPTPPKG